MLPLLLRFYLFFPCTLKLKAVHYTASCHILEDCGFTLLYPLQKIKFYQLFCGINFVHVTVVINIFIIFYSVKHNFVISNDKH
jgi:hypothetical protein